MHSHAFNPSPLPLRSLLKTLALIAIVLLVISYTYWVHVAGMGVGVSVEKGMDESVDEPTGKGWGMGRDQHSSASADTETGHEIDNEGMLGGGGGDDRTGGGQSKGDEEEEEDGERVTHNGLQRLGGGDHANEDEELQEMDLSPGWQTAQASALPTPQPKKPLKPGFQGVHLDEGQEEGGEGGGAAVVNTGGSKAGRPGLLTDEKVAKKMGLVVASKEEVEAWEGFWGGRGREGEEGKGVEMGELGGEGEGSGLGEGDVDVENKEEEAKPSEEGSTIDKDAEVSDTAKGTGAEKEAGFVDEMNARTDADAYPGEDRKVAEAADVKKEGEGEGKDD